MPDFPPRWSSSSANFPTTTPAPPGLSQPAGPRGFDVRHAPAPRVAAWRKALHLRMRRLRQASLGHGRHNHAWFEAAFDRMVLGRLSHGHPFEWDFGAAIAKATELQFLQIPGVGCCAPSCAAPWSRRAARRSLALSRSTRDRDPVADQDRSGLRRRRPLARAKCWSPAPSKSKTGTRPDAFAWPRSKTSPPPRCMASSPPTSRGARRSKPTAGRPRPRPRRPARGPCAGRRHGRPCRSALGPPRLFQRQDLGARRVSRTAEDSISKATSTNSPSASTDTETRHAAFRSLLRNRPRPKAANLQHVDHAGSSGISLLGNFKFPGRSRTGGDTIKE